MRVAGPFVALDDPHTVVWLRAFATPGERDRLRDLFYNGPVWKNDLEPLAMPLLEHYQARLLEASADAVCFCGQKLAQV